MVLCVLLQVSKALGNAFFGAVISVSKGCITYLVTNDITLLVVLLALTLGYLGVQLAI